MLPLAQFACRQGFVVQHAFNGSGRPTADPIFSRKGIYRL